MIVDAVVEGLKRAAAPKRLQVLRKKRGLNLSNPILVKRPALLYDELLAKFERAGVLHLLEEMFQDGEFMEGLRDA